MKLNFTKDEVYADFEAEKEARKWQAKYDSLLKRVREAVEEMQNKGRSVHLMTGIGFAMTILRKHLPELEEK